MSELALLSADEAGIVCLWHIRYCLGLATATSPRQPLFGGAANPAPGSTGYVATSSSDGSCSADGEAAITLLSARSTPHRHRTFGTPAHYIHPVGLPLQVCMACRWLMMGDNIICCKANPPPHHTSPPRAQQMPSRRICSVSLSPSGTLAVVAGANKLSLLRLGPAGLALQVCMKWDVWRRMLCLHSDII